MPAVDSLKAKSELLANDKKYAFFSLRKAAKELGVDLAELPNVIKVVLENLLRKEDGENVTLASIKSLLKYCDNTGKQDEILYHPSRVLMQDFTGVPAVVDLAAMRDAMNDRDLDPKKINPQILVDLVIDHSVQVDKFGSSKSYEENIKREFQRNNERYQFLKWGQESFENFRVIPPGKGICHQVNLEYLASVVSDVKVDGEDVALFDTLVGTDSHTTMINGLSVLGWGVGGIEAEAAMLGQPISLLVPKVVGFKLTGELGAGITATDLVLTITEILRKKNVVGKFVEFYGPALAHLSLFERATIANMAPEYGATCGYFPIDAEVIKYLELTGRSKSQVALVEAYAKEQCVWQEYTDDDKVKFNEQFELDISQIQPCIAGPKRPQDRILLSALKSIGEDKSEDGKLKDGDIVISAITSCTNTSNPYVMIGAGLLAKRAYDLGLKTKKWVKTSLAPGSQVVTEYLEKSGLIYYLEKLGFYLVGYGCTTCIGNSGPLPEEIEESIKADNLSVSAILSGNRNFEGRIHPLIKQNYLASPMLCVAFALVGTININILEEAIGVNKEGEDVFLSDIWPNDKEIKSIVDSIITKEMFIKKYSNVLEGDDEWKKIHVNKTMCYSWQDESTYIKNPPFFDSEVENSLIENIEDARILAIFGDSVTTDHISPAGNISKNHTAGEYLLKKGVKQQDFNSFGSRRGNDEVMVRGTFANIRIKNKLANGKEGGFTQYFDKEGVGTPMTIYDASSKYIAENTPLVIFAGKEYGTGSSRDWAAKGTKLLGIKAVVAESFERIHRSNLIGMGVLPLQFVDNTLDDLSLKGDETISLIGYNKVKPKGLIECQIKKNDKIIHSFKLLSRIDTEIELDYFLNNGILNLVLKQL